MEIHKLPDLELCSLTPESSLYALWTIRKVRLRPIIRRGLTTGEHAISVCLVSSLARPDGKTPGVSILATELDGKRQEILIEAVPGLRRMVALADFLNDETLCTIFAFLETVQTE